MGILTEHWTGTGSETEAGSGRFTEYTGTGLRGRLSEGEAARRYGRGTERRGRFVAKQTGRLKRKLK